MMSALVEKWRAWLKKMSVISLTFRCKPSDCGNSTRRCRLKGLVRWGGGEIEVKVGDEERRRRRS
jgi:hypothetical protein